MFVQSILDQMKHPALCAIDEEKFTILKKNKFAIWGTGVAGEYALKECKHRDLVPTCVCDSFEHEKDENFHGIPLYSAHEFFDKFPNYIVLVCCLYWYGIEDMLIAKGYKIITWDTSLIENFTQGKALIELIKENEDKIDYVYNHLADDHSREVYEKILFYRLTTRISYLENIREPAFYFGNDVVKEIDCGTFVDCGAYTGDTLEEFHKADFCKCQSYLAVEPDERNCNIIKEFITKQNINYAKIIPVGVWEKKNVLHFDGKANGQGRFTEEGSYLLNVDSIDNFVINEPPVGFIKMDIEGGEIPALNGAVNTIREYKPILAISIYHKKQDLWEIPLWFKKINPNYKLYIRHHTTLCPDTVCYAL